MMPNNSSFVMPLANICGYVNNSTGKVCKKPSGDGTTHEGVGRCLEHESTDNLPVVINKSTTRSALINAADPATQQLVEIFMDNPEEIYSLRDTIALLKGIQVRMVEQLNDDEGSVDADSAKTLLATIKQLTSTIATAVDMEKQLMNLVPKAVLSAYTSLFTGVLTEYIKDPRIRLEVIQRIQDGARELL
jgi:hypothetical protein